MSAIAVLNALWVGLLVIAKLDDALAWGWWLVGFVAAAPTVVIVLGCLGAYVYDELNLE